MYATREEHDDSHSCFCALASIVRNFTLVRFIIFLPCSINIYFPSIDPFLLLPSSLFTFLPSFFYLSLTTCVKREIIQTFIIMHNYKTMLVIILGNLNIYEVKLKKSENNSALSWVRTRALMVRRLERKPLTCEIIATALRLLVTWPRA